MVRVRGCEECPHSKQGEHLVCVYCTNACVCVCIYSIHNNIYLEVDMPFDFQDYIINA